MDLNEAHIEEKKEISGYQGDQGDQGEIKRIQDTNKNRDTLKETTGVDPPSAPNSHYSHDSHDSIGPPNSPDSLVPSDPLHSFPHLIERALELVEFDTSCLIVCVFNVSKDVMSAYTFKGDTIPPEGTVFIPNVTKIGDTIVVFMFKILADPYQLMESSTQFDICEEKEILRIKIPDINQDPTMVKKASYTLSFDHSKMRGKNQDNLDDFHDIKIIKDHLEGGEEKEQEQEKNIDHYKIDLQLFYEKCVTGFRGKFQIMSRFDSHTQNREHQFRQGQINLFLRHELDRLEIQTDEYKLSMKREVERARLEHEKRVSLHAIKASCEKEAGIYESLFACKEEIKREREHLIEIENAIAHWEAEEKAEEDGSRSSLQKCNSILES